MNKIVSIALATYNGSKYITEMLDSIEKQTYSHYIVHVCDDGSTDNTINIIESHNLFKQQKIVIHDTSGGNGALKNFIRTIYHCPLGYVALCDQDDYWVPEKLSILLDRIKTSEKMNPGPKLIFSDLEIVDSELNCQYPSFYSVSYKSSACSDPIDFLISNHIPGCAMLFNKELKALIEPIPDNVRMHDWWIALLAATFGEIIFEPASLIKYRQHGGNTIGAADMISKKIAPIQLIKNSRTVIKRSRLLQNNLLRLYKNMPKKNGIRLNVSPSFVLFLERKMTLLQRRAFLEKMRSGENHLLASWVKWFI
ncbi:glycosyltransferase family 2 protein [Enterobacter ludwigii]